MYYIVLQLKYKKRRYIYGDYSIKDNQDAATDGDVDIALALYVAWMQWGDYMGINDARGNPISYKKESSIIWLKFFHKSIKDKCAKHTSQQKNNSYIEGSKTL